MLIGLGGLIFVSQLMLKTCRHFGWFKKIVLMPPSEFLIVVKCDKEGELLDDSNRRIDGSKSNTKDDVEGRIADDDIESLVDFSISSFTDKSENNKEEWEQMLSAKLSDFTLDSEGELKERKYPSPQLSFNFKSIPSKESSVMLSSASSEGDLLDV